MNILEQDQDNVERRSYIKPSTKIYVSHRHTKPLGTHRTLYIFNLNITNLFIYLFIIIWARSQKSLRQKLVPIPLKVSGVAFALSLCCACYTICTSVAIAAIDALRSSSLPRRRSS